MINLLRNLLYNAYWHTGYNNNSVFKASNFSSKVTVADITAVCSETFEKREKL